ncbi:hypothetical protein TSUD_323580 [Trifolium subterraneum]|uniref:Uncharacterized protein n=1 Tax=Trifolium subterraneum TaxID=3900 RepID=A0A2Z6NRN2_TRISU|nr:hypothetical protein TSUD_323580 [Trifolium subterraneum]
MSNYQRAPQDPYPPPGHGSPYPPPQGYPVSPPPPGYPSAPPPPSYEGYPPPLPPGYGTTYPPPRPQYNSYQGYFNDGYPPPPPPPNYHCHHVQHHCHDHNDSGFGSFFQGWTKTKNTRRPKNTNKGDFVENQQLVNDQHRCDSQWLVNTHATRDVSADTGIGISMWGRIQHLVAANCSRENEGQQTQSRNAFLKKVIGGGEV